MSGREKYSSLYFSSGVRSLATEALAIWRLYGKLPLHVDHWNQSFLLGLRTDDRHHAMRNVRNPGTVHKENGNEVPRIFLYHSHNSSQWKDARHRVSAVQDPLRAEIARLIF
jgi:hypothetical protein